jgi:hypothetical protein
VFTLYVHDLLLHCLRRLWLYEYCTGVLVYWCTGVSGGLCCKVHLHCVDNASILGILHAAFTSDKWLCAFLLVALLQRTGLDGVAQQQQQSTQLTQQQQQQQRPAAGTGPHSYPLSDAAITGNSSNSSYRSSAWLLKRVKQLLHGCQRAMLNGVAAVADRLNWW